jgi:hypothetical protein
MAPVSRAARDGERELTMMRRNHELQESWSQANAFFFANTITRSRPLIRAPQCDQRC